MFGVHGKIKSEIELVICQENYMYIAQVSTEPVCYGFFFFFFFFLP